MTKQHILGTGLNGLVGSKFVSDFSDRYLFDNLDLRDKQRPVDITQQQQVESVIAQSAAKFLIHFAAFTNVTAAFAQSGDKNGLCYQVNVVGTKNIAQACQKFNKHLIHISTAYVFNGEKEGLYTEQDPLSPIEWYGQTKAWAEEVVQSTPGLTWTILRIDQPFRSDPFAKLDVAWKLIEGMRAGKIYPQFTDHYFGPTYIDDFAKVLDAVIRLNLTGLYHATSGEQWTDFDFARSLAQQLHIDYQVEAGSLAKYLETSQRPYQKNTALSVDKLKSVLDFSLTPITTAMSHILA
ncbi:MAG TPA: sugar nucleotide-binding protein [Candidatus Woesebacteria bacterium]|nr:sugar nucleotide-binding protein [Candidatus Woesebacteria bacterium]HOC07334.1 sugar nucleotide-binding protein [Candidatus Woesebacteria bacterium]HOI05253.1 sugar nucleotide-binding protein [Candidatus Woesebacteria bacterium]HOP39080.1 sugar nucleotide-binding protein [Candidatus Woesebacteria bacterium]HPA61911.1 sugar nucleotide-binding protein [Candidatus Woesebacteria bacterium]